MSKELNRWFNREPNPKKVVTEYLAKGGDPQTVYAHFNIIHGADPVAVNKFKALLKEHENIAGCKETLALIEGHLS